RFSARGGYNRHLRNFVVWMLREAYAQRKHGKRVVHQGNVLLTAHRLKHNPIARHARSMGKCGLGSMGGPASTYSKPWLVGSARGARHRYEAFRVLQAFNIGAYPLGIGVGDHVLYKVAQFELNPVSH